VTDDLRKNLSSWKIELQTLFKNYEQFESSLEKGYSKDLDTLNDSILSSRLNEPFMNIYNGASTTHEFTSPVKFRNS
jgi:hypothetical protein